MQDMNPDMTSGRPDPAASMPGSYCDEIIMTNAKPAISFEPDILIVGCVIAFFVAVCDSQSALPERINGVFTQLIGFLT